MNEVKGVKMTTVGGCGNLQVGGEVGSTHE